LAGIQVRERFLGKEFLSL